MNHIKILTCEAACKVGQGSEHDRGAWRVAYALPCRGSVWETAPYLPNGSRDRPRMMNSNELVTGGGDVEVRLLLIHEECIWHPDVLD